MIRIATLKLTDVARAFYNGTLELHDQKITWAVFKTAFQNRFRDVRTDQYHFAQLHMARQKKDESPQEFADRCRSLVHKTVPQVMTQCCKNFTMSMPKGCYWPALQQVWLGRPGDRFVFQCRKICRKCSEMRLLFTRPNYERRNETFYIDEVQERGRADRPSRGMLRNGSMRNTTQQARTGCTQDQSSKGSFRNSGIVNN